MLIMIRTRRFWWAGQHGKREEQEDQGAGDRAPPSSKVNNEVGDRALPNSKVKKVSWRQSSS